MKKLQLTSEDDLKRSIRVTTKLEKSLRNLLAKPKRGKINKHQQSSVLDLELQNVTAKELNALNAQKEQLFMDNQFLTQEVLKFKQEIGQLNKQIASLRKYVHFLQTYNQDLKKEMGARIKKPKHQHCVTLSQLDPHVLAKEIEHLRRLNECKESQLKMLEKANHGHSQSHQGNMAVRSKCKLIITPKKSVSFLQKNNPHYNSSKLKKPKPKTKHPHLTENPSHLKSHNCPFHFPLPVSSDFLY